MLSNCIMTFHLWIKKKSGLTVYRGWWHILVYQKGCTKQFFLIILNIYFYLFIWLRWVLLQHVNSLVVACRIYFSDQGWNPGPLHSKSRVLATGTPEESPCTFYHFWNYLVHGYICNIYYMHVINVNITYDTEVYYLNAHI